MRRRDVLIGGSALFGGLYLAPIARAEDTARRRFRILRDGSDVGEHLLRARLGADRFEIEIDIEIRVTILGITAYRYRLENREVWADRNIVSVESRVDDDGTSAFAKIERNGDALEIDGSGYSGTAPLDAATTSYYAPAFLDRRPWISTQSGTPLAVEARETAPRTWNISGELETRLIYDANGEWVGCAFDAGGVPARYDMVENTGAIADLWGRA